MAIEYRKVDRLDPDIFIDVLVRSGLSERRPVNDKDRVSRMLLGSNLIVVAQDDETARIVGLARSITDYAYSCYLSDLAVDREYQDRGIGRQLIAETRRAAGPEAMCLLVSAPDSVGFYETIQMPRQTRAFMFPREK
jgi:ribosomal protein S18 acetylase RimI-like enzyme